jgi:hypothetical protein
MEPVGDVLDGVAVERPVHGDAGAGFAGASTLQSGWRERERGGGGGRGEKTWGEWRSWAG